MRQPADPLLALRPLPLSNAPFARSTQDGASGVLWPTCSQRGAQISKRTPEDSPCQGSICGLLLQLKLHAAFCCRHRCMLWMPYNSACMLASGRCRDVHPAGLHGQPSGCAWLRLAPFSLDFVHSLCCLLSAAGLPAWTIEM